MIRAATPDDADEIARIYNYYIEETAVTFEEVPIDGAEIVSRMGDGDLRYPWFVSEDEGKITGYAYAGIWKGRCSYRHSVESTVYLDPAAVGGGLGTALYRRLIDELETNGVHVVIGGVTLPNAASAALHEKLGFEKVGQFTEVGRKFERWLDVGYWQLLLPRKR